MTISLITKVLIQTLTIYNLLLWIRIILTWFPNLDSTNPVLSSLYSITDPFLNVFRGIIPPIAGLDLSPILAFVSLNLIQRLIFGLAEIALGYTGTF